MPDRHSARSLWIWFFCLNSCCERKSSWSATGSWLLENWSLWFHISLDPQKNRDFWCRCLSGLKKEERKDKGLKAEYDKSGRRASSESNCFALSLQLEFCLGFRHARARLIKDDELNWSLTNALNMGSVSVLMSANGLYNGWTSEKKMYGSLSKV